MALVSSLFEPRLRTRVLALYQGTWMVAQLFGPVIGGVFAEIGWWRGSFWAMVPIIIFFALLAWLKLPDAEPAADTQTHGRRIPTTVQTVVRQRVSTLSDEAQHLLSTAAVVGCVSCR